MKRKGLILVPAIACLAGLLAIPAAPASAATGPQFVGPGFSASRGAFEGAHYLVLQAPDAGGNRKCLDADTTQGGVNGNKVQIYACNNQPQQQWNIYHWDSPQSANLYILVNVKYNKCLDADNTHIGQNGDKVQLWSCNDGPNQEWWLPNFNPNPGSGFQTYYNWVYFQVLDADNSHGIVNSAKVQLYQDNETTNQKWQLANVG